MGGILVGEENTVFEWFNFRCTMLTTGVKRVDYAAVLVVQDHYNEL